MLWKITQIAFRGISANKMRSFLTMLGIIIGVAAVIAMISVGEGAKKQVTESIQRFGTNLLRVRPGAARLGHVRTGSVETLTIDDAQAIKSASQHVQFVAPQVRNMAQVKYGNKNATTSITGTVPQFTIVNNFPVESGRFFDNKDIKLTKNATFITPEDKDFAMSLGAVRFLEKPIEASELLLTVAEVLTGEMPNQRKPLPDQAFQKGYADRLQEKLLHKENQIRRAQRLVETVPSEQRPAFEALLAQTKFQRDQIEEELRTLDALLDQHEKKTP